MNSAAPLMEPQTPIFRVKAGESRVFHIKCADMLGISTHWLGRTRLCTTRTDCPGCFAGCEKRWTGYLAVADHRKVQGLLEILGVERRLVGAAGEIRRLIQRLG